MRALVFLLTLATGAASAQAPRADRSAERGPSADSWCDENRWSDRRAVRVCEVVELAAPAGPLDVAAHPNGAVTVRQWDGPDVRVRARIEAAAESEARARALLRQSAVDIDGGTVRTRTPDVDDGWVTVGLEILTPRRTDLTVTATNGPLTLDGLDGRIRATATNGPIVATGLAGDVRVRSQNGPVTLTLAGETWGGAGLDVESRNGPLAVSIPRGYSAGLDAETEVGQIDARNLPLRNADRRRGRYVGDALTARLGRGGPALRLRTANGPVTLRALD